LLGLLVLIGAPPTFAAEFARGPVPAAGETFRASFENGPRADAGAGFPDMHAYQQQSRNQPGWQFDFTEGRVGRALDVRPDREALTPARRAIAPQGDTACFKSQGYFCLRAGTVSFWFRATGSAPTFDISSQTNDTHVAPLLALATTTESGAELQGLAVRAMDRVYADRRLTPPKASLSDDRWHHIAVVWDEARGMRIYLDGDPWASNWGEASYQTGYLSAGRLALGGAAFDEVRILDVPLSDAQAKALAQGRLDLSDLSSSEVDVPAEHRLEQLAWLGAPADHFTRIARPTLIRRVTVDDARSILISGWRGVDGRQESVWPLHYHSYVYPDRRGPLRLKLADGERFNLVRVTGSIDEASLCLGDEFIKPDDPQVLAQFAGERFITNFHLDQPCAKPRLAVYPEQVSKTGRKSTMYYWSRCRELRDLALLDVRPGGEPADPSVLTYGLTNAPPPTVAGDNRVRLIHWYRPGERTILLGGDADGAPSEVGIEPLRFLHLMLPPQPDDLPLSAVRLELKVEGWRAGNAVNIRLHDPSNLWRALIDVDVAVGTPGELDVALEFPPTLLPADTELWLSIISRDGGRIRCGRDGSRITTYGPDIERAKQSYLTWQHRLLKDSFAMLSEPRPWGYIEADDTFLRVAMAQYDGIARIVQDLYSRFPEDRWTRGYMVYTHPNDKTLWDSLPIALPRDPRVPRWTLLQKELLGEFLYFVHWWIDNRQAPNGELGNGWGDDTDLVGDWISLHLIHDPDGKLKRSLRMVADYCWRNLLRNGLNIRHTDALHAYEDGNNVQPPAALMDYGNPVLWERLLATARRYDGHLLTPPRDGKRTMAGTFYCDEKVSTETRHSKPYHERLILHAGLTLMWYNGHPGLTKMMGEVLDGAERIRDRTPRVQHALYQQTRDETLAHRFPSFATNALWVRLLNLEECEPQTLQELTDHEYELGATRALGFGNTDPLIKYVAWHYTREKSHLIPALEHLWKHTYYTMCLYTKTEQSGDRIAAHKNLTDFMYTGGMPGARSHLVPVFAVSYEGLSPEFAAIVLDDTPEFLRWVGYNFEDRPQTGKLRVWNLVPGTYEARMGIDADGNDRIDGDAETLTLDLKRYETVPITLPSHKLYIVEARCTDRDVPLYERCDLAITHEDAVREGQMLTVRIHNLGCEPSGPFTVRIETPAGRILSSAGHTGLDGVGDLRARHIALTFDGMPERGDLIVSVRGPDKEITEVNNVARLPDVGTR
jgi:hypothetical protein